MLYLHSSELLIKQCLSPHAERDHTAHVWNTPIKLTGGKTYSCQSARGPCTFDDWVYYDDTPFQWQAWMADEIFIPNWQGTVAYSVMGEKSGFANVVQFNIYSLSSVYQGPLKDSDGFDSWRGNGLCITSCLLEK